MNDIEVTQKNLPATLPELSKFVLIGREKLTAVRAEIRAIEKVGLAQEVREQKLREAQAIAEAVLDAEVRIGELIAKIPKAKNQHDAIRNGADSTKQAQLAEIGIKQDTAERFQTIAKHPEAVEQAKAEAREQDEVVTRSAVLKKIKQADVIQDTAEQYGDYADENENGDIEIIDAWGNTRANVQKKPHVTNNSKDDEWYTPAEYIEAARTVMGSIDLDPASNDFANKTVKAWHYFTEHTNGLEQEWFGNIWMNPPYSTALLSKFADKLTGSNFNQAIILVNNATETAWFEKLVSTASAIVFHKGRIRFVKRDGEHGTPLQGQAFIYYGDNPDRFLDVFKIYGWGAKL